MGIYLGKKNPGTSDVPFSQIKAEWKTILVCKVLILSLSISSSLPTTRFGWIAILYATLLLLYYCFKNQMPDSYPDKAYNRRDGKSTLVVLTEILAHIRS